MYIVNSVKFLFISISNIYTLEIGKQEANVNIEQVIEEIKDEVHKQEDYQSEKFDVDDINEQNAIEIKTDGISYRFSTYTKYSLY